MYRAWANAVPSEIELCSVQLPGRENRIAHKLINDWKPIVEAMVTELRPFMASPFAFFGYSMGALLSFELARALARVEASTPIHLHVAAYRAPQIASPAAPIHSLPTDEFTHQIRLLKGTPDEVLNNSELMDLMLPVLRADFAVCEAYQLEAGPPLACPITALGGLDDLLASRAYLEAWSLHTSGDFQIRMYPGGHFFFNVARDLLLSEVLQDLQLRM